MEKIKTKEMNKIKYDNYQHEKQIQTNYGFKVDIKLTKTQNVKQILGDMTPKQYHNKLTKTAYHNLCKNQQPIQGIGQLLGLGLKFCIQTKKPSETKLLQGIERFKRDVRLKHYFADSENNPEYKKYKKLHIKSNWQPKERNLKLENTLTTFENKLIKERTRIIRHSYDRTNLTIQQQNMIKTIKKQKHLIILVTDKNLGPAIMERENYIKHILREHLNNPTYTQLTNEEYDIQMEQFMRTASSYYELHKNELTTQEKKYLSKLFYQTKHKNKTPNTDTPEADTDKPQPTTTTTKTNNTKKPQYRDAKFYGTPKVHKKMTPYIRFRPVVSQCGTYGAYISTYIDFILQPLIYTVHSYVKDSFDVLRKLHQHGKFPPGTLITTSDAESMYTNIDPSEGPPTIEKYINEFATEFTKDHNIPTNYIIKLLNLVMKNNIFQFGNTWWKQNTGTAMGTPCACIYATLFFAYYEQKVILPKYKNNILFYVRMIDDILIVWKPTTDTTFDNFANDLNKQTKLNWDTNKLSTTTDFLDLTIQIDKRGNIHTKTYQKPMNLFLYIPHNSAHPPGMTTSLIYGLLRTYYIQNTKHNDFIQNASLLFNRLLARGHTKTNLHKLFREATLKLKKLKRNNYLQQPIRNKHTEIENEITKFTENKLNPNYEPDTSKTKQLIFHTQFHPRDMSRKKIQHHFKNTLHNNTNTTHNIRPPNQTPTKQRTNKTQLTIAYSKGRNLFDTLCSSTIYDTPSNVSDILKEMKAKTHR